MKGLRVLLPVHQGLNDIFNASDYIVKGFLAITPEDVLIVP